MKTKRVIINNAYHTLTALNTGRILSLVEILEDINNGIPLDFKTIAINTVTSSFNKVHSDINTDFVKSISEDDLMTLFNDVLSISGLETKDTSSITPSTKPNWNEIYSHIIACTGWTPKMIDEETTLTDITALNDYYRKNPPIHMLMASYVGFEHKEPEKQSIDDFIKNNTK